MKYSWLKQPGESEISRTAFRASIAEMRVIQKYKNRAARINRWRDKLEYWRELAEVK